MSNPRPIYAGVTTLVTRRITHREFWLLPKKEVNRIIQYAAAFASRESGVQVHCICAMSNHIHAVVTDPLAELPRFCEVFFRIIAQCINRMYGRRENLFEGNAQPSYVHLADSAAMLEKTAYVVCNPLEARLVRDFSKWPGVNLWRPGRYKARRPEVFFGEDSTMPETLGLEIVPLPLEGDKKPREVMELLNEAVFARAAMLRAEHQARGLGYLGLRGLRAQKPWQRPAGPGKDSDFEPRVATRNGALLKQLTDRLEEFVKSYRVAFRAFRDGKRRVTFPPGVYKMRVELGVRFAEA